MANVGGTQLKWSINLAVVACAHGHIFDTRTGLNNHSTKQHGRYYSLQGDCFVPIGEADLRVRMLKIQDAERHYWLYGVGPRSQGRIARGRGRGMAPLLRFCAPACFPRGTGGHFVTPQAVCFGIVSTWFRPQFSELHEGGGTGLSATPPPSTAAGKPPTPPREMPFLRWPWLTC